MRGCEVGKKGHHPAATRIRPVCARIRISAQTCAAILDMGAGLRQILGVIKLIDVPVPIFGEITACEFS